MRAIKNTIEQNKVLSVVLLLAPSHPGSSGERQVCSLEEEEEAGMKV